MLNASHRQPSPLTSISVCDEVISKSSVATILATNLETLVYVSPSPISRWRRSEFQVLKSSPGGVLPYMGYIGMCRCEGYVFRAVYSRIGYLNQNGWV